MKKTLINLSIILMTQSIFANKLIFDNNTNTVRGYKTYISKKINKPDISPVINELGYTWVVPISLPHR